MYIRELTTWNDIFRNNLKDGNMLSQFNAVSSNKTSDWDFQEWNNMFIMKLQDEQNQSTTTTGYTGIAVDSGNNAQITFKGIYDYTATQ